MNIFLKISMILVIAILPLILPAQNQRFAAMREKVLNARYNEICTRMKLESAKVDSLRPVFMQFEKEKARMFVSQNEKRTTQDSIMTDEQADKKYLDQLHNARKLIEIREKYYPKFRTVLSPKQVLQFNRIEMEINRKMMNHLRKRMDNQGIEK